ncbi:hypothetical protein ASD43_02400 [Microbacterium sp. Root553]|nr:hypothetical protein ASD43_02400 [Microbacterium sp. Root553]
MRTDPLAMPHVTAQASGAWVGMAADYLRAERRSVILETTMRQLPVVESTAATFRTQGYRVEAHVLAVPGAVSALGTVSRYLGEAAGNDQNRWTPSAAHEAAYEAMPVTAEQLVADSRRVCREHVAIAEWSLTPLVRRSRELSEPLIDRFQTAGMGYTHENGRRAVGDHPRLERILVLGALVFATSTGSFFNRSDRRACGNSSRPRCA